MSTDEYILLNYKTKTNAQMAQELGVNKSTISNHRKKLGISATELNQQLRDKTPYICSQYGKKTKAAIAKELNCSTAFIKKIWTENNLNGTISTVYYYDQSIFKDIDTEEKAYALGFLASDGCIYRREGHQGMISISVQESDIEIIEWFREFFNTKKPYSKTIDKRNNSVMVTLQITSDILCNDLLALGIGIRKTFDLNMNQILNNIPENLKKAFYLGYFDGDGSIDIPNTGISHSHVRLSAPLKTLEFFSKDLNQKMIFNSIMVDKRKYTEPFGSLEFKNTTEKYIFLKWIYSSKVNSLNRKKEKAFNLIARIENNVTNRAENLKAIQQYKSVVLKWEELLER